MGYLHNIPTNERKGKSRKENDLQRESSAVTYALREDRTIHTVTTLLFQIKNIKHFLDFFSCPSPNIRTTSCKEENITLEEIRKNCDGKLVCEVRASNSEYGDPCPDTFKYVEFSYICI